MNALHVTLAEKQAVIGLIENLKRVMDLLLMNKQDAVRAVRAVNGTPSEYI